jgi:SAM-dependent methyltransferase
MHDTALLPPISAFRDWLQTPPGRYLLECEQELLNVLVPDIFGYHALQVGVPELDGLRTNRMPHRWRADTLHRGDAAQLVLDAEDLPFAAQSLDLVVLAHVLEFSEDPHQVLREVERVLIPEGRVLVLCLNPFSLWGLRQRLLRGICAPYLPREGHFIRLQRLKDWFRLLSLEPERGRFGCYVPPARSEKWLQRWSWTERAGERWWPVAGNVYAITAVKRVRGMHLVGPAWKRARRAQVSAIPVGSSSSSPRNGSHGKQK